MGKNYLLTKFLPILFITICKKDTVAQSDSDLLKQDSIAIKEETFWKGTITLNPHGLYFGRGLAHDGSFFTGDSGSLRRIYFKTGKVQTLVKATNEESAGASVVSPDNHHIAFTWFNGNFNDLMVVSSKTKNGFSSQPRLLIKGTAGQYPKPHDWSPDGKWILVRLADNNGEKIALVSLKDGSVKLIKNIGKHSCNKISFSPDGRNIVYDYASSTTGLSDIRLCSIDGSDETVLVKDVAVAPYWSPDGKYVFFLMKKNDNALDLYALQMTNLKPAGNPFLIKEGIDFFSPVGFLNNGTFLYGKSSPTKLNIYISRLDLSSTDSSHVTEFISHRFSFWNTDAVWSPDGSHLSYNSRREEGKNAIVIRSMDTGQEEDITTVPGSLVQWFPDNTSLLIKGQEKNGTIPLYRLNVKTKDTTFLIDLNSGMEKSWFRNRPVLSADAKFIYYTESKGGDAPVKIFSRDIQTGLVKKIATLDSYDITSFSASPDGMYLSMIIPYSNLEGYPSALKVVSLQTGEVRELVKEPWGDATKFFGLEWSPDSRYIYYVRTNVQTGACNVWRVLVAGGQPDNTGIAMTDLRMPKIHPDGKHIVFSGGEGWYKKTYEVRAVKVTSNTTQSKTRL